MFKPSFPYRLTVIPVLILLVISACSGNSDTYPEQSQIVGLASPVTLNQQETEIYTPDYFIDYTLIDSVSAPEGLQLSRENDFERITLSGSIKNPLATLEYHMGAYSYHQLLKKSSARKVTLGFEADEGTYDNVQLKGEMNSWNPSATTLEYSDGRWTTDLYLNEGLYQYLFVADGEEMQDPSNPETVSNGMGGMNSLLKVGNPGAEKPMLKTEKYGGSQISLTVKGAEEVIAFWENHRLEVSSSGNTYTFAIPAAARGMERTHIRAWAYGEDGVSNDVLIPLEGRQVVSNSGPLDRTDYETWNMYFVLIDRFKDGDPSNTRKVEDANIHPKANYYGGDLEGIIQTIESGYFDEIGVNTLWLSPITQNPEGAYGLWDKGGVTTEFSGYHGYWPVSSSEVDDRFGSGEKLKELLDVAHANGMSVILDYVANHVHELHPVYQRNKDWATDLYLPDGRMNTELWDEQRLTTWFDTFMPSLDFSKPEVIETMTDSALFWVKEYELDGFRHDATKHIQLEFWRTLTRKIKDSVVVPQNRPVFQIGETYGSRELIASYINSGMLDSQFDFNIFDAGQIAFGKGDSFKGLASQLKESFKYYGYHNTMGYISGNHDKTRFITLTSGEVSWDEDGKLAGWSREIGDPQEYAYDRLNMFHAFNQTIPGIPVTYYGDEFGMTGANDPDNRRWMRFGEDELTTIELRNRGIFSKLTGLRNNNLALTYGDFSFDLVSEDQMAYSRSYFGKLVVAVFNKAGQTREIEIPVREGFDYTQLSSEFGYDFRVEGNRLFVTLPANRFDILTN